MEPLELAIVMIKSWLWFEFSYELGVMSYELKILIPNF
ncbi:hypothetical protein GXM_04002 [Nostoc sphaeroides CCNUC1]|uniref:Uncharacterized protein n=1 Tax=Nostoc sphaeroides CCNUC1 TaxID=2653204 RepID=A0A5P8W1P8_9NOSO|nr:hypothetical protein GXM_04002 [Nostoc sphaeroides CCNUC1]